MAVSGTGNWGGVHVHVSLDGSTYRRVGSTRLKARYGTLRSAIAAPSADPDTTHTLAVQLTDTTLPLPPATDTDARAQQTLCLVGYELVSYVNSALVGAGQYDLTRIYRGRKGSTTGDHASGDPFMRVDGTIFRYTYDKSLVNSSVYIKLTAFNVYGGSEQDISTVSPYTITLTPLAPPSGTLPDYIDWGSGLGGV